MKSPEYWAEACHALSRGDPVMARLIRAYPGTALRSRGNAFETLLRAIVGQQISVKAADAVWARVSAVTSINPETISSLPVDALRACGLSRMKAEYAIDLAMHFAEGRIRPRRWARMEDEAIIAELVDVRGIGRWTAEMFLIFHLLRPNVWPVDDLGLVRTLAEPNLTAVSGEPAKFLAGGEYPVPVVDSSGQISVVYKEFGVGLSFTPIVMSEGRISLKIETEVSELTNQGAVQLANLSIPALKKRTARSTVELPSGGSLALAGLLSEDTRQNIDGFPGLKDLPVLGTLFRSRDFVKQETELVVIVTPYMVRPTARKELARPLDGLAEASDMKANFLGHLNRVYGRGQAQPVGDLKGDYGFIVE